MIEEVVEAPLISASDDVFEDMVTPAGNASGNASDSHVRAWKPEKTEVKRITGLLHPPDSGEKKLAGQRSLECHVHPCIGERAQAFERAAAGLDLRNTLVHRSEARGAEVHLPAPFGPAMTKRFGMRDIFLCDQASKLSLAGPHKNVFTESVRAHC